MLPVFAKNGRMTSMLYSQSTDISTMRVKEIKEELEQLNVDFTDCFDKESLISRLVDARSGKVEPNAEAAKSDVKTKEDPKNEKETKSASEAPSSPSSSVAEFDKDAALEEIRGMRVRELREELGRRQISRAGLFEKEDLVQALLKARELASNFSPTGLILPGVVADLTETQLEDELKHPTPMLLDVYATWCGPCQMMAPQLQQAAAENFGSKIRVAKMDSDKNPQLASKLRVSGLPTLVLFNNGEEIDRIEGALMKDQLVQWVNSKLQL